MNYNQIIKADGFTLIPDGSGNTHLTVVNGIPIEWGGGTLYDNEGNEKK